MRLKSKLGNKHYKLCFNDLNSLIYWENYIFNELNLLNSKKDIYYHKNLLTIYFHCASCEIEFVHNRNNHIYKNIFINEEIIYNADKYLKQHIEDFILKIDNLKLEKMEIFICKNQEIKKIYYEKAIKYLEKNNYNYSCSKVYFYIIFYNGKEIRFCTEREFKARHNLKIDMYSINLTDENFENIFEEICKDNKDRGE